MLSRYIVVLAGVAAVALARTTWDQLSTSYTFDVYCAEFGRNYAVGSEEYVMRKALFDAKLGQILAHNAIPSSTWKVWRALGSGLLGAQWTARGLWGARPAPRPAPLARFRRPVPCCRPPPPPVPR